tara:strand:- start:1493 stop:1999 length:507 start_codon:yes stop_codon:yes gene_type:complete
MLSIESKPSSAEEGIMINLERSMNETQPVIIDGKEWYHKKSVMEAYPRSIPATYTHLKRVNDFLCTKLVGNAAYIRFDETIDWRMELMAGAISVNDMSALNQWDSVSKIMRNCLEMTAMHNQIESYVSLNGDVFAEYDGIVNDIQKQLKEQARINSRLQRAFKRIGDA